MVRRLISLLCLAALVVASWLAIGGSLLAACGLLLWRQSEHVAYGAEMVGTATVVGATAYKLLARRHPDQALSR